MRRFLLLTSLIAAASGCTVCERDSAADGLYTLLTDCAGAGLVRGSVEIGPFAEGAPTTTTLRAANCSDGAADGGVHAVAAADAGAAEPDETTAVCERSTYEFETSGCPQTAASGASLLGLPSAVSVLGARDFELHGEVGGRVLDCARERFGDEKLLLCRERGLLVCAAVLEAY